MKNVCFPHYRGNIPYQQCKKKKKKSHHESWYTIAQLRYFTLWQAVCNKHLIPRNMYCCIFQNHFSYFHAYFFIVHLFVLWLNYDHVFFSTVFMPEVNFLFDRGQFENGAIFPSPPAEDVCLFI